MEEQDLPVARDQRHFEDYAVGSVAQYGPAIVDEAEVIEFGRRFDPQDFHTDPVKAAKSPFGGVIASGWHTGSMMMRVLVDRYLSRLAGMGSPGMEYAAVDRAGASGRPLVVQVHGDRGAALRIEARSRRRAHSDRGDQRQGRRPAQCR